MLGMRPASASMPKRPATDARTNTVAGKAKAAAMAAVDKAGKLSTGTKRMPIAEGASSTKPQTASFRPRQLPRAERATRGRQHRYLMRPERKPAKPATSSETERLLVGPIAASIGRIEGEVKGDGLPGASGNLDGTADLISNGTSASSQRTLGEAPEVAAARRRVMAFTCVLLVFYVAHFGMNVAIGPKLSLRDGASVLLGSLSVLLVEVVITGLGFFGAWLHSRALLTGFSCGNLIFAVVHIGFLVYFGVRMGLMEGDCGATDGSWTGTACDWWKNDTKGSAGKLAALLVGDVCTVFMNCVAFRFGKISLGFQRQALADTSSRLQSAASDEAFAAPPATYDESDEALARQAAGVGLDDMLANSPFGGP